MTGDYMREQSPTRKARFRAALALAGLSIAKWCELEGYTATHVHLYFAGRRDSQRLTDKIDRFIEQHLPSRAA